MPDNPLRRTFLQTGAGALAANSFAQVTPRSAPVRRPNLILLMTDGHRPDALSINGNRILSTPNLDRIGREGVMFTNSFVTNSICLPSRATCLTGLYSHSNTCIDNQERPIPHEIPLISDILHQNGYEVALCGKAHIGQGLRDRYWDYYFGYPGAANNTLFPNIREGRNGTVDPVKQYDGYVDDVVCDRAFNWLRQKHEKPFCLFLWFQSPHAPFFRPRRYLDSYNGVPIPKPATFDDDLKGYPGKPRGFANARNKIGSYTPDGSGMNNCARTLEEVVKDYYAGIAAVDDRVKIMWDILAETGQLDDTAVIFTADHGFFLGEWRMYDKRLMHEPSIRTPLFVRYPRMIHRPAQYSQMAINVDLAPTMLELAGLPVPANMQGRSLTPFLRGQPPAQWRQDWLYEYYEYPGPHSVPRNRGVRTDRYKYIHYYQSPEEFELYDLQEDPGELHNLYGDPKHAELTQHLRTRLTELRRETGDTMP